ncbi:hypothetical protein C8J56DRAFT_1054387 [Mycena floridula]|nr:hypothetical protein C8J56DRAFT_1054387 [Mycena floridula]
MRVLTLFSLLLSGIHLSYAETSVPHRRQSVPSTLPGHWQYKGCIFVVTSYTDNVGARTLDGPSQTTNAMTVETCIAFCDQQKFVFAGLEFASQCFCGNFITNGGSLTPDSKCNSPCAGNSSEFCGAGGELSLFWSGVTPPSPPQTVAKVGNWISLGCYGDAIQGAGRTLRTEMGLSSPTTIEACTSACFNGGFQFSGTEFSDECYCDTVISNGGAPMPLTDCSMLCSGNSSEFCGGPNRLNLYNYTGTDLPHTGPPGGGGGASGPTGVSPVLTGLPSPWAYNNCWVDNANGRVFEVSITPSPSTTVESCIASCSAQNFTVAGLEFSDECYCGNRLINGAALANPTSCNMGCAGASTEACGGPGRLSVYSTTSDFPVLPVPTPLTTNLPGDWTYKGCYADTNDRILTHQNIWPTNNTVEACINQCDTFGYTAAGVEFGVECYCGDSTDVIQKNSTQIADSQCNVQCSGDPIHLCGGGLKFNLYEAPARDIWNQPAITGRYEFFMPGVVVPLLITLGINNKVMFLEKHGTGFPNTTGSYELDLSLTNSFATAWRELHLKTDVFCSASIVLPDKAARHINVGGWAEESNFGIRLYTPNGSPGVNGTNDWEEDVNVLSLQVARWYPTAAMLPNGTILVMGGEIGSNSAPQPNLELLPKPEGGPTLIDLDFLRQTDPFSLYPFVMVLPSGNLFVAYYNEARIISAVTFDTVKVLPNMPGSVSNFLGGRTYPLQGAAVIFPQFAPYTDPLRILLCGGSTGPGPADPLDNCVSIQPEVENATWTIERMPSPRVMSCMSALPDGTFLIVNGAHQGVAGFGLASSPNLNALLYDPSKPVHQRISILNNTIVPRLYHSESTLLPDGRVMISGSDPQTPGFDEEFRVEVYIPPYLVQGFTAPTFNITQTDWQYGGTYSISNVKLHQGTISNLRISLLYGEPFDGSSSLDLKGPAATSSTHGNTMGQRTIFPAFSCSGTTCTITAPPNAFISPPGWHQLFILDGPMPSHSAWVRIGGDPAQLGNWPNLPGFTPPGV